MTINARTSRYGTAGGSNIDVDHGPAFNSVVARKVQLSADYTIGTPEPGAPTRPVFTGCEVAKRKVAGQVVASGTQVTLSAEEAAALVAAGKASYV